ncbi:hypothetical protein BGZ79_009253 [Entomortierella chlamydospora]|nr:hypothetical protein BGZ79_009253 [Entomortierella chlamydospora]
MHASLVEKDSREDVLLIKDTRSKEDMHVFKDNRTKATTGSSVSSLYPLKDFEDSGTESGFFVFPDLSVRMEGTYRLKFCLYEMVGKDVHFCDYIISDPLVVYSAKKFPGMEESTQLSQYFAEQGLKIRIRKEVRPKNPAADPQHQDTGDAAESQDDDDPPTSKRRVSGTRNVESRRDDHSVVPQKAVVQFSDVETRSDPTSRSSGLWRGQAPEHPEYQAMSNVVDRSVPAPESYHQQHGHFMDNPIVARRVSATNRATESISHMDVDAIPSYSSGARSEQQIEGSRSRPKDQVSATADRSITSPSSSRQESLVPYRAASLAKQPAVLPISGLDGQHLDQKSVDSTITGHNPMGPFESRSQPGSSRQLRHDIDPSKGYHDETRHRGSTEIRPEPGLEHPSISDSHGVVDSQWYQREHPPNPRTLQEHIRNPQTQPFPRQTTIESSYSTYPSRQGYTGTVTQRSSDYITPTAYMEDHQKHGPAASIPYDRPDHPSRPQPDALSQHKPSFHPPQYTQHPSHISRDLQYVDNQTYPPQDQIAARARPASHHDSYSGFQHQAAPFPYSVPHGKYPGADAPNSSYASHGGDHSQSGRYPSAFTGEAMAGQGRYPSHSHPSHPSSASAPTGYGRREDPEAPRRTSLTSSPPRLSDHRSQSMTHLARTVSTPLKPFGNEAVDSVPPSGYATFHRDRENDSAPRHSIHPSPGHSLYQDGSPQSMSGPGIGTHHPRGNPSPGPYPIRPQEPAANVGKSTLPHPASIEYGLEGHPPYGHARSMSSSSNSRLPHVPVSAVVTTAPPSAIRQGISPGSTMGPGQSRGPGHYEGHEDMQARHYATVRNSSHDPDLGPYGGYTAASAPGGIGGVGGGGSGRSHEHGCNQSVTAPPPPSSGLLPGHGLPGSHNYGQGNSYTNSKMGAGPSGHSHGHQHPQQFQAHRHQYQQYAGGPPQGHVHSHNHGHEEQKHAAHGHPYP